LNCREEHRQDPLLLAGSGESLRSLLPPSVIFPARGESEEGSSHAGVLKPSLIGDAMAAFFQHPVKGFLWNRL